MKPRIIALCIAVGWILSGMPSDAQLFERTNPQREIELGRQAAMEVRRQMPPSADAAMQERVRRIGQALVNSMPERAYPYEFSVLAAPEFNAFCLPGGFMFVNEGLLIRLPDDDSVAFVMAHEIIHASHRHWRRMVEKMKGPLLVAILGGTLLGSDDVAQVAATLVQAQYSREQETDADVSGAELAWRAGYDPQGAVTAAEVMAKMEIGHTMPVYLRSHPPGKDRAKNLRQLAGDLESKSRPSLPAPSRRRPSATPRLPDGVTPGACRWFSPAVGDEWVYRITSGGRRVEYSVTALGHDGANGPYTWRMAAKLPDGQLLHYSVLTASNGVWRTGLNDSRRVWISEWIAPKEAPAQQSGTNGNEDGAVITPAGRFEPTLRLQFSDANGMVQAWYAEGIGLVKRVYGDSGIVEQLVRFKRGRMSFDLSVDAPMKTDG